MKILMLLALFSVLGASAAMAQNINCKLVTSHGTTDLGTGSWMPIDIYASYDANDKLIMSSLYIAEFYKFHYANKETIKKEREGDLFLYIREEYSDKTLVARYLSSENVKSEIEIPIIESKSNKIKINVQLEPEIKLICN